MVPRAGFEPARAEAQRILSPSRLPVPPPRLVLRLCLCLRGPTLRMDLYRCVSLITIPITVKITLSDIPNQSRYVALFESLYLISAQAMRPPTQPSNRGSSHHAGDVRSTDVASLCSLEIGAPHSGQNKAFLDILAPQAGQECRAFPQYWQKVASAVILPHRGHLTLCAISISRYNQKQSMSICAL